ncbi:hypothetical protein ACFOWX_12435 [Sphingorhabdus arenilitoris]|uniref:CBM-cenC domain-containing protein n=1 Tax=Sphingorhabdus arenilitoris TaxID=1490041 RepID=A0ABV8RKB6_9SPHN
MLHKTKLLGLGALLLASSPLIAAQHSNPVLQAIDDALPGDLINDPTVIDWVFYGNSKKPKQVEAPETPGKFAMQMQVTKKGANKYDMGINIPLMSDIKTGHVINVAFWARVTKAETEDGKGDLRLRINENKEPYPGFGEADVKLGNEWYLHEVQMRANRDIAKKDAVVGFQLAGAKQTVEIGQVYVLDLGAK